MKDQLADEAPETAALVHCATDYRDESARFYTAVNLGKEIKFTWLQVFLHKDTQDRGPCFHSCYSWTLPNRDSERQCHDVQLFSPAFHRVGVHSRMLMDESLYIQAIGADQLMGSSTNREGVPAVPAKHNLTWAFYSHPSFCFQCWMAVLSGFEPN